MSSARSTSSRGMLTEVTTRPRSRVEGMPKPRAATFWSTRPRTTSSSAARRSACDSSGVGHTVRPDTLPLRSTSPAAIFVPPRSTPMTRGGAMERRLRYSLAVAGKDKPYRVYRGGRAKGPIRHEVPKQPRSARQRDDGRYRYPGPQPAKRARRRWPRRLAVGLVLLLALALVWGVLGFLAFRSGVSEANARLDPRAVRALSPPDGAVLATPANTLLLGVDRGLWRGGGSA